MKIIKISPRGYCYGVVDAMVLAQEAAHNPDLPRPIYILGMIVHNQHVVDAFEKQGIITLDGADRRSLLEQIDKGTVIFTAHGVSPDLVERAKEKGLAVVDATCPDVTSTHELIRKKIAEGYHIIYIGKKGHPEPEGALGIAPEHTHLIEKAEDVEALSLNNEKILVTNQTTMSQWDIRHIMDKVVEKFPHAEVHNEICMATQLRQEAVAKQAAEADLLIVVGDPRSNNSNRLAQVAEEIAKVPSYRIADLSELNIEWLKGKQSVAVTAGASTPTPITREVITFLEQYDESNPETWKLIRTINPYKILPPVRNRQGGKE